MLFTGDLNEFSELTLLDYLRESGNEEWLTCDVLKVPHHGSNHALEAFFRSNHLHPAISISSMGDKGFRSKAMGSANWQHPSTDVIKWLGGPQRFYTTFAHESRFAWSKIDTAVKRNKLIEKSHILIETDGHWFRVVEIPVSEFDGFTVPPVNEVRRSNGTRWISTTP